MPASMLEGGFADASLESAGTFRALMSAMARPGRIEILSGTTPPPPLDAAAAALVLTLCDPDTGIHLAGACDTDDVRGWIAFHTGAPIVAPASCRFAIGAWADLLPLDAYSVGTAEYPDRSATLVASLDRLDGSGAVLTGPGIAGEARLSLPETAAFGANARRYPLGLDFFFTAGERIAAVPRTTRVGGAG
jgi:alpha-D-ribose 1-methylphosphonate 5-triphosphate synthase subunit PhnH